MRIAWSKATRLQYECAATGKSVKQSQAHLPNQSLFFDNKANYHIMVYT